MAVECRNYVQVVLYNLGIHSARLFLVENWCVAGSKESAYWVWWVCVIADLLHLPNCRSSLPRNRLSKTSARGNRFAYKAYCSGLVSISLWGKFDSWHGYVGSWFLKEALWLFCNGYKASPANIDVPDRSMSDSGAVVPTISRSWYICALVAVYSFSAILSLIFKCEKITSVVPCRLDFLYLCSSPAVSFLTFYEMVCLTTFLPTFQSLLRAEVHNGNMASNGEASISQLVCIM